MSLTSSGQEFMGYATQMMQIAECSLLLGKPPKEMGGVLRLGILESLFNWVLCDQIPQYHRDFPKIILETRMTSGDDLLQMLKHNELDMIFFLGKKTTERDFIRACAHLINIVFVTYPEHPLAGRGPVSLADVVRQPMILPERKAIYRRALEEEAAQKNLYIAPFLEIDNSVSIVSLLKQKLGISFLPEYVVRSSVQKGELVILPAEDCSVQLWSQVFYHKSKWVTPPMDSLIQLIQDRVFQDRFLQNRTI
ncbi:MAG: LysR family transcriptional regulator substrate-binding protein [Faecalispora jeddahensis]